MFIQPVTGYRKVVTPAFRSQTENPLLKQSDITRLDSKLVIGRAPGACRYENHQYKINSNILDKDLQFLKSNYNVDTLIDLRAGHIEGNEITKEANAAKKAGMTYLNLQMDGAIAPKPDELKSFFNTIDKAKGNVYLHCHMGHDRTGVMSACYMAKVHKLNEEFAFQKVFDERGVTRLKYMYGHPDQCKLLSNILKYLKWESHENRILVKQNSLKKTLEIKKLKIRNQDEETNIEIYRNIVCNHADSSFKRM